MLCAPGSQTRTRGPPSSPLRTLLLPPREAAAAATAAVEEGRGRLGKNEGGGKRPNEESYPHSTHLSRLSGGFSSFSLPLLEAILFLAAEKRGGKKARIRSSHPPQKGNLISPAGPTNTSANLIPIPSTPFFSSGWVGGGTQFANFQEICITAKTLSAAQTRFKVLWYMHKTDLLASLR